MIAEATIKKGQALIYGPNMLEFADIRYWADLYVVREIGPAPLVVGFCLAIIGLIMRLIFYRKEVKVVLTEDKVYMLGRSEYNQHSFEEEMDSLVERLSGHLMKNKIRVE